MTALILFLSALCFAQTGPLYSADVFTARENNVHTYRIPAITMAKDGTLLAFSEARHESKADSGNIDIVVKRSSDGGRTWSPAITVWDDAMNVCGNPTPVVDRVTGTIILLACWNDHDGDYMVTHDTYEGRRVFILKSEDNGLTWSEPRELTREVKLPDWKWYATGPCHGLQLKSGRIVIPCNHGVEPDRKTENGMRAHVIYSDDLGDTWKISNEAGKGNECTVAELSNGDVLINVRGGRPANRAEYGYGRILSVSSDGGATFGEPYYERSLIEPVCNGAMISYDRKGRRSRRLVFSNPHDTAKRRNMSIQMSVDDGKTWKHAYTIYEGPSAYSDIITLPDGSVGVLYENGVKSAYEKITFTVIPAKVFRKIR